MKTRRAFSRTDLVAVIIAALLIAILAGGAQPAGNRLLDNLKLIGMGTAQYQDDNRNYVPITLCYSRGTARREGALLEGWCSWSFGGKNNTRFWAGQAFDVEAADRPLNPYVLPGQVFGAPPFPVRMSADDPRRQDDQAKVFKDPADRDGHERKWPLPTPGVSCYEDVGTSYMMNMAWWYQVSGTFKARMAEGTRRIAAGEGANPSRFVWLADEASEVVLNQTDPNYQFRNGYGDINRSSMLYLDGHAAYNAVSPQGFVTGDYTFRFE